MNYTETFTETPRVMSRRRVGAWVLSHTQMGLLLGCIGIGLVLAFGAGFIVGVWYQASEHVTPYPERQITVADQPPPADSPDLTFYSTLTTPGSPTVPTAVSGAGKGAARQAGPATSTATLKGHEAGSAGKAVTPSKAPERPAEPARNTPGTPAKTVAPPKVSERVAATSGMSPRATDKPPVAAAGYSVQVGSFQYRDQAESLRQRLAQKGYQVSVHPTAIAGKGVWYRVQVGASPDRSAADRLAQQLSTQDRVTGVVVDGSR